MTRRPLRLAGHGLVVSRRVGYARAARRARLIARRMEEASTFSLAQWQRDYAVRLFVFGAVYSVRVDSVTS